MTSTPHLRLLHLPALLSMVALAALPACSSQASRLYTLSSDVEATARPAEVGTVGVRPVAISPYLDRPQILIRATPHRLEVAEFERWAEPLDDTIPRVIADNLRDLLGSSTVFVIPRARPTAYDVDVDVSVTRFEVTPDGDVLLTARWAVYEADAMTPLAQGRTELREEREGGEEEDMEGAVARFSKALGALSGEIAEAIRGAR